ncbi:MAG: hypothetical protein VYA86_03385 [Candidatus Thermoplasmatota archaeon]|nr:hypothetical protein [Candidatus Thermoplasmatota archaeon]
MFDPASLLDPQTYDPRNPLVGYVYLIILAIIIRIVFIILPLRDIYKRYTNQGLKDLLFEIKRESKITGIEGFIIREIILLLVPLLAVITFKIFQDPPGELVWNNTQIISASIVGAIWISLDVRDSFRTRKALQPFGARKITWKWYVYPSFSDQESKISTLADPKLLHLGWWSRKKLVDFSKWEVEYIDTDTMIDPSITEKPILITSEEGKLEGIDKEALKEKAGDLAYKGLIAAKNLHSTIKEGISEASGKTVERIDDEIQKRVDTVTKPTLMNRLFPFLYNLVMILGPLFFIYGILPTLG